MSMQLHRVRTQEELDFVMETVREVPGIGDDEELIQTVRQRILMGDQDVLVGASRGKPVGCIEVGFHPPYVSFGLYRSRSKSFTAAARRWVRDAMRDLGMTKAVFTACGKGARAFLNQADRASASAEKVGVYNHYIVQLESR